MKRFNILLLGLTIAMCSWASDVKIDKDNCTITKEIVDSFEDVDIKIVDSFENMCGKVKIVDSFEDVKVKIVDSFEDIKIKIVDSFEGVKK